MASSSVKATIKYDKYLFGIKRQEIYMGIEQVVRGEGQVHFQTPFLVCDGFE